MDHELQLVAHFLTVSTNNHPPAKRAVFHMRA